MAGESSDIMKIYKRDVGRYATLDRDEERRLGLLAREGDEQARARLVEANLKFVISVARKYRQSGLSDMDLIQAGNMGLMHAVSKFDPTRSNRLISYAVWWIRQYVQKEVRRRGVGIVSDSQKSRMARIKRLQAQSLQERGREMSVDELCEETGFTKERVVDALNYRGATSFDEPVSEDGAGTLTRADVIGDDDAPEEREHEDHLRGVVGKFMGDVLSEREQEVVRLYRGFAGPRAYSLTEIGIMWGITRERVRQLKDRAEKKLAAASAHHADLREVFVTEDDMRLRRERFEASLGPCEFEDIPDARWCQASLFELA